MSESEYQMETHGIPFTIENFWFPIDMYKTDVYLFIPNVLDTNATPRQLQIAYKGTTYDYFQDLVEPGKFYFLPDSFKLRRRLSSPHYPCLLLSVEGDTLESAQVTASFVAMPVFDQKRLDDAARNPEVLTLAAGAEIQFQPLPARAPVFRLRLPEEETSGPYPVRAQAHVDVATGIQDEITKALSDFRRLFDALFDQVSLLFTGYVTVTLGSLFTRDIPFSARIDDLAGDVFDQTIVLRDANTIGVTLRNGVEGTIRLLAPPTASVQVDRKPLMPCTVREAPPAFPVELKPGDEVKLVVVSGARLVDGQYKLFVETEHKVESTSAAVLDAVLDPHVETHLSKKLVVQLPSGVFASRAAPPAPQLVAVEVVFESGATASFASPDASNTRLLLAQTVTIPHSIVSYLLGSPDDGSYKYRVDWVFNDGHREQELVWRTDNRDPLTPDLVVPTYPARS